MLYRKTRELFRYGRSEEKGKDKLTLTPEFSLYAVACLQKKVIAGARGCVSIPKQPSSPGFSFFLYSPDDLKKTDEKPSKAARKRHPDNSSRTIGKIVRGKVVHGTIVRGEKCSRRQLFAQKIVREN